MPTQQYKDYIKAYNKAHYAPVKGIIWSSFALMLIFGAILLCLVSCGPSAQEKAEMERKRLGQPSIYAEEPIESPLSTVHHTDGCDYVILSKWNGGYMSLVHSGNCPNLIHHK